MRYEKILAQSRSRSRHSLFQKLPNVCSSVAVAAVSFYNAGHGKVLKLC